MAVLIQFLAFFITIMVLVSIHEAGHFLVAKLLGIKVLRFSVGFGKAIAKFHDKNGTEYRLAMIPLGGYVKLLDEREGPVADAADIPFAFNRQPLWVRTLVVLAGPATNVIFAIIGFWLIFMLGVESYRPVIGKVLPASIAQKAGLQAGDEIVKVGGMATASLPRVVMAMVMGLGEKNINMTVRRPASKVPLQLNVDLANWRLNKLNPDPLTSLGIEPLQPPVPTIIGNIKPSSPAAHLGLKTGDQILTMNRQPFTDWAQLLKYIRGHANDIVAITYHRAGQTYQITAKIGEKTARGHKYGYLGIEPKPISIPKNFIILRQYPPGKALVAAVNETKLLLVFNYVIIKKMILGQISLSTLGGPISVFQTADFAFKQGVVVFLGFLSLISVMLAFINVLPIPGLDGGYLLNFLIEGIIRRPLSLRFEMISIQVGMMILLLIMLVATLNDLMRLFT